MAQRKITINLPQSPEMINDLLAYLLQHGFIAKKGKCIIEKDATKASKRKNRWALAAERLDKEGFLDGQGDKVKNFIRDFREGFTL
ncbi:MAG: hypothetical protein MUF15_26425 [Acidobacteria bacterium]|jgi:hypothetical protein|nr:hypothetical protein [Acidobacteriota bacterium]